MSTIAIDPSLDLVLERTVAVPPALVWRAWTEPEHLKKWFTPRPWTTPECEMDLRPGGLFRTVMRSPEGAEHENIGCFLEIVPEERLVFTDALGAGYRPRGKPFMTGVVTMEPADGGTLYRAVAIHGSPETRKTHEAMGFHDGWATALDQLVEVAKTL